MFITKPVYDVIIVAVLQGFEYVFNAVSRFLLVEESLFHDSLEQLPTTYKLQDNVVVTRLLEKVQLP